MKDLMITLQVRTGFGCIWTFEPGIGATIVKPGDEPLDSIEGWKDKVKFPDLDALDWEECAKGIEKIL